jgi:1-acyl-sn-glycerol-3-phosphate acyltransferase
MKIAFVLDQFDNRDNGTTIAAARFIDRLRERGHEVRVVATGKPAPDKYVVPPANFGILDKVFISHGMIFGHPDKAVLREALEGVDVVHLHLPFRLCMAARQIAKEKGIPYMGAFHCQPENISYNIHMKYLWLLPVALYHWFHHRHYRYVSDIHCPSPFIASQLKKHGYKANLHVISNGVDEAFRPIDTPKPDEWKDKFVIISVGRLAGEKRQDLIIKAALRSKHRDNIQIVLLGKGPRKKSYERLGKKLKNKPIIKYIPQEELVKLYNQADLYVHAAEAEIEGLVCTEAISCGLVPVIAKAKMSAASQFALDERSVFKSKDVKELTRKIDYWIEHPEERARMKQDYHKKAGEYSLDSSVDKLEEVYRRVIKAQRRAKTDPLNMHVMHMPTPLSYKVDEHFRFVNRNLFFRIGSSLLFYLIGMPVLTIASRLFLGLRIKGQQNLRYLKGGAVTVTNHVHMLDSTMVACTLFPRKPLFASLKSNFEIPFIRWLVRLLGGVPIPESPKALHAFMEAMRKQLQKGRIVHFYPEASLWPRHTELRPFKNGAFHLAVKSGVPIVPMVFTFREPGNLVRKLHKKELVTLTIGKPEYPAQQGSDKSRMNEMREAVEYSMANILAKYKKTAS